MQGQSFEETFPRLVPYAQNVGWRFLRDGSLAADVAQETLTRAFERWSRLQHHENIEGWIVMTALNVSREIARKRRPFVGVLPVPALDGEDPLGHPEVLEALHRVSRRQREVFVYRFAFDLSVADTAGRLGLTEQKVKDATHEALTNLRRRLRATQAVQE